MSDLELISDQILGYDQAAHGWPEAFLRVFDKSEQFLNERYLFSVFADGRVYCKACGRPISDDRAEHLAFHEQEIEILLEDKREAVEEAKEARICMGCGASLPIKRGRPPKYCEECQRQIDEAF